MSRTALAAEPASIEPCPLSLFTCPLVSEGLTRLERMLNPGLGLLGRNEFHEVLALEIEEPLLVDQAAGRVVQRTKAPRPIASELAADGDGRRPPARGSNGDETEEIVPGRRAR